MYNSTRVRWNDIEISRHLILRIGNGIKILEYYKRVNIHYCIHRNLNLSLVSSDNSLSINEKGLIIWKWELKIEYK